MLRLLVPEEKSLRSTRAVLRSGAKSDKIRSQYVLLIGPITDQYSKLEPDGETFCSAFFQEACGGGELTARHSV